MRADRLIAVALGAATSVVVLALQVRVAGAHQNPGSCNSNNLALNPSSDRTVVRNGDTITYRLTVANLDTPTQVACDVTSATVTLTLPGADGTPTGNKVVLASGVDYPAGTPVTEFPPVAYTVAVNPGVTNAEIEAEAVGVVHRAEENRARIVKTLSTLVSQPHTTLSVSADPASGEAPLKVTYTYSEVNDGSTNAPISEVKLSDDVCSPVTLTGGDGNGNGALDRGETWSFTCTRTFRAPGTFTSHVTGTGVVPMDGQAAPLETAEVTVTVGARVLPERVPLPVTGGSPAGFVLFGAAVALAGPLVLLVRGWRPGR